MLDCLVVGAGPVGLAMASGLARFGVKVRIIDKAPEPSRTGKAAGVWSRTMEVLHNLGAVQPFLEEGVHCHAGNAFSGGRRLAHVQMSRIESPFNFVLCLPQGKTERFLGDHLRGQGVEVERRVELTGFQDDGEGVDCTLQRADGSTETVRTRWLLGCDGAHSTLRKTLDLPFEGEADPHLWMVGDVDLHGPIPEDEVYAWLHEDGVLALFPLGGHHFRFVAEAGLAPDGKVPPPTLEDFQAVVDRRGPGGLRASNPGDLDYFHINERQVPRYRVGRIFLAGDAAHIHSPLGGQGMNTGIQDTHNLAWKLAMVTRGLLDPRMLDTYQPERHPVAAEVIRGTTMATKAITVQSPVVQAIRNKVMSAVGHLSFVQDRLRAVAAELDVNYRKSALSREGAGPALWRLGSGVPAGDRAPDMKLFRSGSSDPVPLFDVLSAPRFHLLLLGGATEGENPWPRLAQLGRQAEATWPELLEVHHVVLGGQTPEELKDARSVLLDTSTEMHQRYAAGHDACYLVRPDGYVAFRSQPANGDALGGYLKELVSGSLVAEASPA